VFVHAVVNGFALVSARMSSEVMESPGPDQLPPVGLVGGAALGLILGAIWLRRVLPERDGLDTLDW
jgi:hypothetical protein